MRDAARRFSIRNPQSNGESEMVNTNKSNLENGVEIPQSALRNPHSMTPRSVGPILQAQPRDALELAGVVGDQRRIERQGVAGDPQGVGAEGRTGFLEPGELRRVMPAEGVARVEDDRHLPRQRLDPAQHLGLAVASLSS